MCICARIGWFGFMFSNSRNHIYEVVATIVMCMISSGDLERHRGIGNIFENDIYKVTHNWEICPHKTYSDIICTVLYCIELEAKAKIIIAIIHSKTLEFYQYKSNHLCQLRAWRLTHDLSLSKFQLTTNSYLIWILI